MARCNIGNCDYTAIWAWQPFGPDDKVESFALLGSHYRGFPTVKVCDDHKAAIENPVGIHRPIPFTYHGVEYAYWQGKVIVPTEQEVK